jgi:hypothetical protein
MSQQGAEPRASGWLKWEWRGALITIVGGVIIVAAVFGYLAYRRASAEHQREMALAAERNRQIALVKAAATVCNVSLNTSKNLGIVPRYAALARALPIATKRTGRYVCVGGTNVSHYNMVVDLLCKQVNQSKCINLVAVVQDDGTILYRKR